MATEADIPQDVPAKHNIGLEDRDRHLEQFDSISNECSREGYIKPSYGLNQFPQGFECSSGAEKADTIGEQELTAEEANINSAELSSPDKAPAEDTSKSGDCQADKIVNQEQTHIYENENHQSKDIETGDDKNEVPDSINVEEEDAHEKANDAAQVSRLGNEDERNNTKYEDKNEPTSIIDSGVTLLTTEKGQLQVESTTKNESVEPNIPQEKASDVDSKYALVERTEQAESVETDEVSKTEQTCAKNEIQAEDQFELHKVPRAHTEIRIETVDSMKIIPEEANEREAANDMQLHKTAPESVLENKPTSTLSSTKFIRDEVIDHGLQEESLEDAELTLATENESSREESIKDVERDTEVEEAFDENKSTGKENTSDVITEGSSADASGVPNKTIYMVVVDDSKKNEAENQEVTVATSQATSERTIKVGEQSHEEDSVSKSQEKENIVRRLSSESGMETGKEYQQEDEVEETRMKEEVNDITTETKEQTEAAYLTERKISGISDDFTEPKKNHSYLTTEENKNNLVETSPPISGVFEKDDCSNDDSETNFLKDAKEGNTTMNEDPLEKSDAAPKNRNIETTETKATDMDNVDIDEQQEEETTTEESRNMRVADVADEDGQEMSHDIKDKALNTGVNHEKEVTISTLEKTPARDDTLHVDSETFILHPERDSMLGSPDNEHPNADEGIQKHPDEDLVTLKAENNVSDREETEQLSSLADENDASKWEIVNDEKSIVDVSENIKDVSCNEIAELEDEALIEKYEANSAVVGAEREAAEQNKASSTIEEEHADTKNAELADKNAVFELEIVKEEKSTAEVSKHIEDISSHSLDKEKAELEGEELVEKHEGSSFVGVEREAADLKAGSSITEDEPPEIKSDELVDENEASHLENVKEESTILVPKYIEDFSSMDSKKAELKNEELNEKVEANSAIGEEREAVELTKIGISSTKEELTNTKNDELAVNSAGIELEIVEEKSTVELKHIEDFSSPSLGDEKAHLEDEDLVEKYEDNSSVSVEREAAVLKAGSSITEEEPAERTDDKIEDENDGSHLEVVKEESTVEVPKHIEDFFCMISKIAELKNEELDEKVEANSAIVGGGTEAIELTEVGSFSTKDLAETKDAELANENAGIELETVEMLKHIKDVPSHSLDNKKADLEEEELVEKFEANPSVGVEREAAVLKAGTSITEEEPAETKDNKLEDENEASHLENVKESTVEVPKHNEDVSYMETKKDELKNEELGEKAEANSAVVGAEREAAEPAEVGSSSTEEELANTKDAELADKNEGTELETVEMLKHIEDIPSHSLENEKVDLEVEELVDKYEANSFVGVEREAAELKAGGSIIEEEPAVEVPEHIEDISCMAKEKTELENEELAEKHEANSSVVEREAAELNARSFIIEDDPVNTKVGELEELEVVKDGSTVEVRKHIEDVPCMAKEKTELENEELGEKHEFSLSVVERGAAELNATSSIIEDDPVNTKVDELEEENEACQLEIVKDGSTVEVRKHIEDVPRMAKEKTELESEELGEKHEFSSSVVERGAAELNATSSIIEDYPVNTKVDEVEKENEACQLEIVKDGSTVEVRKYIGDVPCMAKEKTELENEEIGENHEANSSIVEREAAESNATSSIIEDVPVNTKVDELQEENEACQLEIVKDGSTVEVPKHIEDVSYIDKEITKLEDKVLVKIAEANSTFAAVERGGNELETVSSSIEEETTNTKNDELLIEKADRWDENSPCESDQNVDSPEKILDMSLQKREESLLEEHDNSTPEGASIDNHHERANSVSAREDISEESGLVKGKERESIEEREAENPEVLVTVGASQATSEEIIKVSESSNSVLKSQEIENPVGTLSSASAGKEKGRKCPNDKNEDTKITTEVEVTNSEFKENSDEGFQKHEDEQEAWLSELKNETNISDAEETEQKTPLTDENEASKLEIVKDERSTVQASNHIEDVSSMDVEKTKPEDEEHVEKSKGKSEIVAVERETVESKAGSSSTEDETVDTKNDELADGNDASKLEIVQDESAIEVLSHIGDASCMDDEKTKLESEDLVEKVEGNPAIVAGQREAAELRAGSSSTEEVSADTKNDELAQRNDTSRSETVKDESTTEVPSHVEDASCMSNKKIERQNEDLLKKVEGNPANVAVEKKAAELKEESSNTEESADPKSDEVAGGNDASKLEVVEDESTIEVPKHTEDASCVEDEKTELENEDLVEKVEGNSTTVAVEREAAELKAESSSTKEELADTKSDELVGGNDASKLEVVEEVPIIEVPKHTEDASCVENEKTKLENEDLVEKVEGNSITVAVDEEAAELKAESSSTEEELADPKRDELAGKNHASKLEVVEDESTIEGPKHTEDASCAENEKTELENEDLVEIVEGNSTTVAVDGEAAELKAESSSTEEELADPKRDELAGGNDASKLEVAEDESTIEGPKHTEDTSCVDNEKTEEYPDPKSDELAGGNDASKPEAVEEAESSNTEEKLTDTKSDELASGNDVSKLEVVEDESTIEAPEHTEGASCVDNEKIELENEDLVGNVEGSSTTVVVEREAAELKAEISSTEDKLANLKSNEPAGGNDASKLVVEDELTIEVPKRTEDASCVNNEKTEESADPKSDELAGGNDASKLGIVEEESTIDVPKHTEDASCVGNEKIELENQDLVEKIEGTSTVITVEGDENELEARSSSNEEERSETNINDLSMKEADRKDEDIHTKLDHNVESTEEILGLSVQRKEECHVPGGASIEDQDEYTDSISVVDDERSRQAEGKDQDAEIEVKCEEKSKQTPDNHGKENLEELPDMISEGSKAKASIEYTENTNTTEEPTTTRLEQFSHMKNEAENQEAPEPSNKEASVAKPQEEIENTVGTLSTASVGMETGKKYPNEQGQETKVKVTIEESKDQIEATHLLEREISGTLHGFSEPKEFYDTSCMEENKNNLFRADDSEIKFLRAVSEGSPAILELKPVNQEQLQDSDASPALKEITAIETKVNILGQAEETNSSQNRDMKIEEVSNESGTSFTEHSEGASILGSSENDKEGANEGIQKHKGEDQSLLSDLKTKSDTSNIEEIEQWKREEEEETVSEEKSELKVAEMEDESEQRKSCDIKDEALITGINHEKEVTSSGALSDDQLVHTFIDSSPLPSYEEPQTKDETPEIDRTIYTDSEISSIGHSEGDSLLGSRDNKKENADEGIQKPKGEDLDVPSKRITENNISDMDEGEKWKKEQVSGLADRDDACKLEIRKDEGATVEVSKHIEDVTCLNSEKAVPENEELAEECKDSSAVLEVKREEVAQKAASPSAEEGCASTKNDELPIEKIRYKVETADNNENIKELLTGIRTISIGEETGNKVEVSSSGFKELTEATELTMEKEPVMIESHTEQHMEIIDFIASTSTDALETNSEHSSSASKLYEKQTEAEVPKIDKAVIDDANNNSVTDVIEETDLKKVEQVNEENNKGSNIASDSNSLPTIAPEMTTLDSKYLDEEQAENSSLKREFLDKANEGLLKIDCCVKETDKTTAIQSDREVVTSSIPISKEEKDTVTTATINTIETAFELETVDSRTECSNDNIIKQDFSHEHKPADELSAEKIIEAVNTPEKLELVSESMAKEQSDENIYPAKGKGNTEDQIFKSRDDIPGEKLQDEAQRKSMQFEVECYVIKGNEDANGSENISEQILASKRSPNEPDIVSAIDKTVNEITAKDSGFIKQIEKINEGEYEILGNFPKADKDFSSSTTIEASEEETRRDDSKTLLRMSSLVSQEVEKEIKAEIFQKENDTNSICPTLPCMLVSEETDLKEIIEAHSRQVDNSALFSEGKDVAIIDTVKPSLEINDTDDIQEISSSSEKSREYQSLEIVDEAGQKMNQDIRGQALTPGVEHENEEGCSLIMIEHDNLQNPSVMQTKEGNNLPDKISNLMVKYFAGEEHEAEKDVHDVIRPEVFPELGIAVTEKSDNKEMQSQDNEDLHQLSNRNTQSTISYRKDEEIPRTEESSVSTDQSEACRLEMEKDKKPYIGVSNYTADETCKDNEKDSENLRSSSDFIAKEKLPAESTKIEKNELPEEKILETASLSTRLKSSSDSEVHNQTNKQLSQIKETSNDIQDWVSVSVEHTPKQTSVTSPVTKEVHGEVVEAGGSENIEEHITDSEVNLMELQILSFSDATVNQVKDHNFNPTEKSKAKEAALEELKVESNTWQPESAQASEIDENVQQKPPEPIEDTIAEVQPKNEEPGRARGINTGVVETEFREEKIGHQEEPHQAAAELDEEGRIGSERDDKKGYEYKEIDPVSGSKDADVKVAHKKSHHILSGVGSKVKHSISKVKKAITGKSSHPKSSSPK